MKRLIGVLCLVVGLSSCTVSKLFEDGSAIVKDDRGVEFGVCLVGWWGCADGGTPSVFVGDAPMPVPELVEG